MDPTANSYGALMNFLPAPEYMSDKERSLLEYHRDNLRNKTYLDDDQGLTTIFMTGVTGPDGRIYNVPGYFDGERQSEEASRARAEATGWGNYPSYATGSESNDAAHKFHEMVNQDMDIFNSLVGKR
jgi:hypothetical protein